MKKNSHEGTKTQNSFELWNSPGAGERSFDKEIRMVENGGKSSRIRSIGRNKGMAENKFIATKAVKHEKRQILWF
jgi:hypothetical protein